jgi:GST-like protein
MIDVYTWPTPNGHKVHIMLEETGLEYKIIPVNIGKGDQFDPEFLKISPNNKMPAIVDYDVPDGKPYSMFESGAILMYLGDKTGQFFPTETTARYLVAQWLMFQMGHVGPMLGQAHHFRNYAPEPIPYAIERYSGEANRLYTVLNTRLAQVDYVAGDYSIADMAIMPWLRYPDRQGVIIDDYPHVQRWLDAINARPAVVRGLEVLASETRRDTKFNEEERSILFGDRQVVQQ